MNKKEPFLIDRIKSVGYAFKGAWLLVTKERSIQVQVFIGVMMTILGFYFNLSPIEWAIQFLTIGTILAVEAVNSAIEEIADFIHPEFHPKIGTIKDISAGAVFIMSVFAVIVGIIIYYPKIF